MPAEDVKVVTDSGPTRAASPAETARVPGTREDLHLQGATVELMGISRRYGKTVAVDTVDLRVRAGEFLAIVGPSGCGKSSLLRLIGGLDSPSGGSILIDGREVTGVPANRRPTSTVFQRGAVFPHLNVFDNVAYPLRIRRARRGETRQRVAELLQLVRLEPLADRLPSALSGGQLQRVALARALAARPAVLLMDEPLSALDAELKRELELELRKIHRAVGVTVLYVTHDQQEAMTLADRIAVMNLGRIQQCGTPVALLGAPENEFVARFFGHSQVVKATVLSVTEGTTTLTWEGHRFTMASDVDRSVGTVVAVALRPGCLRVLGPGPDNVVRGRVTDVILVGDVSRVEVQLESGTSAWTEMPAKDWQGRAVGDLVGLQVDPGKAVAIREP